MDKVINGTLFWHLKNFLVSRVLPRSEDDENARREFILNTLLLGVIFLSAIAAVSAKVTFSQAVQKGNVYKGLPGEIVTAIALIFLAFYFFSRAGLHRQISVLFIAAILLPALYTSYVWGAVVPQVLLIYALVIVMAGILVGINFALFVTIAVSASLFGIFYLQNEGLVSANTAWREKPFHYGDIGVFIVTLIIIAIVSWLFNREIEKALYRARGSEKALKKERDLLEIKIEERTEELKRTQLEKILHLYRLADFGRMTAGLFHDLVNPLTMISLNLEQLQASGLGGRQRRVNNDTKKLVGRAVSGTKQMEEFVESVRRQIQKQEVKEVFSLNQEINQTIMVVNHKAQKLRVKLNFIAKRSSRTYGNPLRFNQLVTNLIVNAIDACEKSNKKNRKVIINLSKKDNKAVLVVQDFGCGITKKNLKKVFDPFFTTKTKEGTGIGLAICKEIVEKDLKGKIEVESTPGKGTTFVVTFPIKKRMK